MMKLICGVLLAVVFANTFGQDCFPNPDEIPDADEWNTGYKIQYFIPVEEELNGWTATLMFPESLNVLEHWAFDVISSIDNKVYNIESKSWNGQQSTGSILLIEFVAKFDTVAHYSTRLPCLQLHFNGGTPQVTTDPPAATTMNPPATTTASTPATTSTTTGSSTDYEFALDLSLRFFEAQRSGELPNDNRILWRGDSALQDGGFVDLTGGWYDAGDRVKFGLPMASSATMLLYGLHFFKQGYQTAGQYKIGKDQVKWALDYFLKCSAVPGKFYVQVGNGNQDHSVWDRPESITETRQGYFVGGGAPQGGADAAGETAAALAAGSIIFQDSDSEYSEDLLEAAKSLYGLAKSTPLNGTYNTAVEAYDGIFYRSYHYKDELAHAAAWLSLATGDTTYRDDAVTHLSGSSKSWAVDWGDKFTLTHFLMYVMTNELEYKTEIMNYMNDWPTTSHTPKGLAYRLEWGSLRYSANTAMLALLAAGQGIEPDSYKNFAKSQIDYMLGLSDNGRDGFSYLIGFGDDYPLRPHHRGASCPVDYNEPCTPSSYYKDTTNSNPNNLLGALVGGPDNNDNYSDDRGDYRANEVATDYNAGFTSALAGLIEFGL